MLPKRKLHSCINDAIFVRRRGNQSPRRAEPFVAITTHRKRGTHRALVVHRSVTDVSCVGRISTDVLIPRVQHHRASQNVLSSDFSRSVIPKGPRKQAALALHTDGLIAAVQNGILHGVAFIQTIFVTALSTSNQQDRNPKLKAEHSYLGAKKTCDTLDIRSATNLNPHIGSAQ